jgi:hypothetical protein
MNGCLITILNHVIIRPSWRDPTARDIVSNIMPPAIISPSVLASDFGQLTAECKRMLRGGAQWLHMGTLPGTFNLVEDNL